MIKEPDFIAELYYHTAEEGGRATFAVTGYRPHIKFDVHEMQTSGSQHFIGTSQIYPGDNVMCKITMVSPQIFKNLLEVGSKFKFMEGSRVIGFGVVNEILNPILLKK